MTIDRLAYVHPKAELGKDVVIGPFSFIGKDVQIGDGTIVKNSVTITGRTAVGSNNNIYHNAVIGAEPQDVTYRGEDTSLTIGDNNVIRECVTINLGTRKGGWRTVVGNNNLIMACTHVAHDCIIEDDAIIANSVLFGGHVKVEKHANIMGMVGIQPFATIGQYAYVGGLTRVVQDVPPFMIVEGNPSKVRQTNVVGLKRGGFQPADIDIIKTAYKRIFRSGVLNRSRELDLLESDNGDNPAIRIFVDSLRNMDKGKHGRFRESLRQEFEV